MSIFNWWDNEVDRDYVVKKLEKSSLFDESSPSLDLDRLSEKRKLLADKTKDKLSSDEFNKLFEHATQVYLQILLYNQVFEKDPAAQDLKSIFSMIQKNFSCQNMKSYAERVADFAKTLEELDVTHAHEVVEILPILCQNIILSARFLYNTSSEFEENGETLKQTLNNELLNIVKDLSEDVNIVEKKLKNNGPEILANEVETKLNEMS